MDLRITIISPNSINGLVFVTKTCCAWLLTYLTIHHAVFWRRVPLEAYFRRDVSYLWSGKYNINFCYLCTDDKNKGSRGLSLNPLKLSTFCRHSAFVFSAWLSAQRVIRALYGINLLVFINEAQCVYCAVRIEFLNIPQCNLGNGKFPMPRHQAVKARWQRVWKTPHIPYFGTRWGWSTLYIRKEPLGSNGKDVGCAPNPAPNAVANTKIPSAFSTVLANETQNKFLIISHTALQLIRRR
jgi:hypothetical protein